MEVLLNGCSLSVNLWEVHLLGVPVDLKAISIYFAFHIAIVQESCRCFL